MGFAGQSRFPPKAAGRTIHGRGQIRNRLRKQADPTTARRTAAAAGHLIEAVTIRFNTPGTRMTFRRRSALSETRTTSLADIQMNPGSEDLSTPIAAWNSVCVIPGHRA